MAYDAEHFHTVDPETGRVHQWAQKAIERHIDDEVGDLTAAAQGLQLLVNSGADRDEMVEAFVESAFPQGGDVYDRAREFLTDAVSVKEAVTA